MKGMFEKDMEIMRGNMKTFIGVYIIAIFSVSLVLPQVLLF